MRRLFTLLVFLILLVGATAVFIMLDPLDWGLLDSLTGSDQPPLPTHTLSPTQTTEPGSTPIPDADATVPVPITSSDGCTGLASASGVVIDASTQRATAPRTLPNGQPFPGTEPRGVGVGGGGSRAASILGENSPEVMIQFTPDSTADDRDAYIRSIGTLRQEIAVLNTYIVLLGPNVRPDRLPESAIVVTAEINEIASATQTNDPNDTRYLEQWSFPIVGLPEAWEAIPEGRSVIVAVIDSGICANHPDLVGRIVSGYDFVENDNDPADVFGHGCSVAGVIAANANNGIGIAGVAPNVQIMPLRVLDASGIGNYASIAMAIVYATDNGADIINMSLAGPTYSQIMADAVAYAVKNGIVIVAAAGNQGRERAFYPAAFPSVIAVGSIDPDLQRSSFSNYGADIDIWAPGRDILTTTLDGGYNFESGTSFAAPIVSGITAMTESFDSPLNTEDGIVFLYPPDNIPNCDTGG
ncbi:MAG: S8 family peptidase [Anaerolineae bacterium]|nr:S8 family peptidase [Anaerolineae bacterium]MDQ7036462.1 S8 family peptidase [Anaerolineae bacterium]